MSLLLRPPRAVALLAVLLAAVLAPHPPPLAGQEEERPDPVELEVDRATGELTIRIGDLLDDGGLRRALESGLPLRIHLDVELWKDGFFDSQRGKAEWRASVIFEPLGLTYRIETSSDSTVRVVGSLEAAGRALARSFAVPLRPTGEGRFYYLGVVEVETLSLSDLEELRRWLRGDLAPSVGGEGTVEGAVEKGVRRLVVRVLGLPARRIRLRTETFRFGGEP